MKNSRPPPAKRTIVGQRGGSDRQQNHQSPRHSGRRQQHPQQQQKEPANKNETPKTASKKNPAVSGNDNIKSTKVSNADPICDICAQNVPGPEREEIFAFGKCDHHVCYVCSARLRAICDQQECPICRDKLESVIFSANKDQPFDKRDLANYIHDEKYKIYFENSAIQDAFKQLLKLECLICSKDSPSTKETKKTSEPAVKTVEFSDVLKLRHHLDFKHRLRLCDLCLTHNKLFPFEYSYYDNASLRKHRKEGEQNTSHRGHPDCILCHNTFFNQDELLQHMSREHYHCHLCGRHNTTTHIYFSDYASLRDHFKGSHYLCERGNCRHEQFTSAFDTQIDYKLHIVNVHGGSANAGRAESRHSRTITLDSAPHRPSTSRQQSDVPRGAAVVSTGTMATANANDPRRQIPEVIQMQMRQQRLPTRAEFPTLGNMTSESNGMFTSQSVTVTSTASANQFPSLVTQNSTAPPRAVPTSYRITAGPSSSRSAFNRTAGGGAARLDQIDQLDFPPLPEQVKPKSSKSKSKQSKPPNRNEPMTLDQLISNTLVLSSRINSNGKNKANKAKKSAKPKPLKFQL